jgi:hypothetical protein
MEGDILKGVDSATDDSLRTKNVSCFADRHIALAKMHAISTYSLGKQHIIVYDERRVMPLAHRLDYDGSMLQCRLVNALHAELNPPTTALKGCSCRVYIGVVGIVMGDKLQFIVWTLH